MRLPALEKLQELAHLWHDSEDEDSDDVDPEAQRAAAAADADAAFSVLLSWLGRLQQLTSMELELDGGYDCLQFLCGLPAAAFSALTASSGLQQLRLRDVWWQDTAWPHMFAADRKLLQLTSLSLYQCYRSQAPCLPPQLLQQVAAACPALVEMEMWLAPQEDVQLAQLQQFTGSTACRPHMPDGAHGLAD